MFSLLGHPIPKSNSIKSLFTEGVLKKCGKKDRYNDLADQLPGKMVLCTTTQLSKNHNYWEFFSPDNEVLNCSSNYIWDSIIAKLLIEKYHDTIIYK
jgi:hypothetical protein